MSRVFVTQEVLVRDRGQLVRRFDLSSAEEYGEIVYLVQGPASAFSIVPVTRQLTDGLRSFTEQDYLLPLGDPTLMMAAGIIASKRTGGVVNVLKWDRRSGAYLTVTLRT